MSAVWAEEHVPEEVVGHRVLVTRVRAHAVFRVKGEEKARHWHRCRYQRQAGVGTEGDERVQREVEKVRMEEGEKRKEGEEEAEREEEEEEEKRGEKKEGERSQADPVAGVVFS